MPRVGSFVLGDYSLLQVNPRPNTPADIYTEIQNPDRDSWLTITNTSGNSLNVQPAQGLSGGSSGAVFVQGGQTIPALTIAQVPIDPDYDVLVSVERPTNTGFFTRDLNTNAVSVGLLGACPPSTIGYQLLADGGSSYQELYPFRSCQQITWGHSGLGASIQRVHAVTDGWVNPAADVILLSKFNTSPSTSGYSPWGKNPSHDSVIRYLQLTITALGASSQANDLICTVGNGGGGITDINLFGGSSVGGNITNASAVLDIGAAKSVAWLNNSTTNISFIVTYYVGLAPTPPLTI